MNDNTVCCQNESATEPQRDPRLSVKPNFKNSNFSKEEFSDTSSVPKTLFILFINGGSKPPPYEHNLDQKSNLVGDDILGVPFVRHNRTKSLPLRGNLVASDC